MSNQCTSMKAYADAEDRLLDLLSPSQQKIEEPIHRSEQQQVANTNDLAPPSGTPDPSVDSVVQLISNNNDVLSLISSEEFLGFSDVDDGVIDDHNCEALEVDVLQRMLTNEYIYGVQRRRKVATSNSKLVEQPSLEQKVEDDPIESTPPKRQRLMENCELDTAEATEAPILSSLPPPPSIAVFELNDEMVEYYADPGTGDDLEYVPPIQNAIEHDACEIIFGNAYAIQTIVGSTSPQQCIMYDNSIVENVPIDICIVDIADVDASETNISASEIVTNAAATLASTAVSVCQQTVQSNEICVIDDSNGAGGSDSVNQINNFVLLADDNEDNSSLNGNKNEYFLDSLVAVENEVIGLEGPDDNETTAADAEDTASIAFIVDDDDDGDEEQNAASMVTNNFQTVVLCDDETTTPEPVKEITIEAEAETMMNVQMESPQSGFDTTEQLGEGTEVDSHQVEVGYNSAVNEKSDSNFLSCDGFVFDTQVFEEANSNVASVKVSSVDKAIDIYDDQADKDVGLAFENNAEADRELTNGSSQNSLEFVGFESEKNLTNNDGNPPDIIVHTDIRESKTTNATIMNETKQIQKFANSTTTEFPNSSTSQRNCSDDDEDLALLSAYSTTQRSPILKNTLSTEALDRKLASICGSNPQMSLHEKIVNWNCELEGNYSEVEDVATFDNLFECREMKLREQRADSTKCTDFQKFRDLLIKNMKKLQRNIMLTPTKRESGHHATNNYHFLRQRHTVHKKQNTQPTVTVTAPPACGPSTSSTNSTTDGPGYSGGVGAQQMHLYEHLLNTGVIGMHDVQENTSSTTLKQAESNHLDGNIQAKPSTCNIETQTLFTDEPKEAATSSTQLSAPEVFKETTGTSTTDLNETMAAATTAAMTATNNFLGIQTFSGGYEMPMQLQHQMQHAAAVSIPMPPVASTHQGIISNNMYMDYSGGTPLQSYEMDTMNRTSIGGGIVQPPSTIATLPMSMNTNEALFYEQHEFCNYLGLTGLATANAVAVAMQELANSSVARRSLRVRSQQQLERMRSGTSHSRKRDKSASSASATATATTTVQTAIMNSAISESGIRAAGGQETNNDLTEGGASEDATRTTSTAMMPIMCTAETSLKSRDSTSRDLICSTYSQQQDRQQNDSSDADIVNKPYKLPCITKNELEKAQRLYNYFCRKPREELPSENDKSSHAEVSILRPTISRGSLNMAPTSITSEQLHERIQTCLKKSREAKPTIYIVKAMNHNKAVSSRMATAMTPNISAPHPSLAGITQEPPLSEHTYINIKTKTEKTGGMSPKLGQSHYRIAPTYVNTSDSESDSQNETAQQRNHHRKKKAVKKLREQKKIKKKTLTGPPKENFASAMRRAFNSSNLKKGNDRSNFVNQSARALVTRSTSHLNSRQLRTRKISLMKSYFLTEDALRPKRLSGGSATGASNSSTPRAGKTAMKRQPFGNKANSSKLTSSKSPNADASRLSASGNTSVQKTGKNTVATAAPQQMTIVASPKKMANSTTPTNKTNKKGTPAVSTKLNSSRATPAINSTVSKNIGASALTGRNDRQRAKSLPPKSTDSSPTPSIKKLVGALQESVPATSEECDARTNTAQQPSPLPVSESQIVGPVFFTNNAVVTPPLVTPETRRILRSLAASAATAATNSSGMPSETTARSPNRNLSPPPVTTLLNLPSPAFNYPTYSAQNCEIPRERAGAGYETTKPQHVAHCIQRLTDPSPAQSNPLSGKHGKVLYIYYEQDLLIVVQEKLVSFWKYSQIFSVLRAKHVDEKQELTSPRSQHRRQQSPHDAFSSESELTNDPMVDDQNEQHQRKKHQDWVHLGRARRVTTDIEVAAPYANRICVNNSTPVYVELRCRPLDHNRRDCKLLSTYVNVYYYSEEDLRPKMHSVHLDAVQGDANTVIYTTITDSRYFVMAWPQDTLLGKTRTGLCKYSLTPSLDTLASIREFKHMKHELKYIECLGEDRLIAYSNTRVTIWDHRSGDTIMSYDLLMNLGLNLGTMYYPSIDIGQSSLLVLYQYVKEVSDADTDPELNIIACEVSAAAPMHRVLQVHKLPKPQFDNNVTAINTGDHIIIQSKTDEEIWISGADPRLLTIVAPQKTQRFYSRSRSQVIELTQKTLTVDSIANHMLKLATEKIQKL